VKDGGHPGDPDARPLSIVVVGGSGDLARKKVFPALFALYCQGFLPRRFSVFGFARSGFANDAFRERVGANLTCRYTPARSCSDRMREFLARCFYVRGDYGSENSFLDLYRLMRSEDGPGADHLFYLAIPSTLYAEVARALGDSGLVRCGEKDPWTRAVVEKPFGKDRESSDALAADIAKVFSEEQTYRIDHYLGKEAIQNLLVLRFANSIFEPIWNRRHIASVRILWKEDLSVGDRGGYFDGFGIIRDVMQNHLLQMMALTAMEPPPRIEAKPVRDEKVRLLRAVPPVSLGEMAIGQYRASERGGVRSRSYTAEPGIPPDSITPTFAAAVLRVENERWAGVPFLLSAGKGLDGRMTEIRVLFRSVPGNVFCGDSGCPAPNELVIRVQPDESVFLRIINKAPGSGMRLAERSLDLRYSEAFSEVIPDAYENLLLQVLHGDRSLFIRGDELKASWDIFTPVLREMERVRSRPEVYDFGSGGPPGAELLAKRFGL